MNDTQNDLFPVTAGFRLQYLEVLNWGTFNKSRWQIRPDGFNALLTGDIGSGKSTLVDAVTCLLVPHNRIVFNKAAGAEGKERNLLSYVKGEYKKEKEEITKAAKKIYLRPDDNTYTVIVGNFHNQGYSENVCLAQVFWIGKDSKVEKLLLISTTPLTINEHFSGISDINFLRKKLRGTPGVQLFNENFSQYIEHFRRLFGMNSEKAIDLFYQTVSMKSVSSLTDFVREQMLERTDVKEQITHLLKRFDDLKKSHEAVVIAREQFEILKPLTESSIEYTRINKEIDNIEAMLELIPAWFAEEKIRLLKNFIDELSQSLEIATAAQKRLAEDLASLENKKLGILQDIDNNGGKRLEQIQQEITQHERDKTRKKEAFDDYDKLVVNCKLETVREEKDFLANIEKGKALQEQYTQLERELTDQRDNVISLLRKNKTELDAEYEELQSLKERKSQIPGWLIGFRHQLCMDLRIDESELPFAGELVRVIEGEEEWEGAIEKLFRDAGISLLVQRQHYKTVSRYVNDNLMRGLDGKGIKLTYLEADLGNSTAIMRHLDDDSIVYKVDIKPDTGFASWLENYLQQQFGSFLCVDVEKLQHVPYGITRQGLIKSGKIRHTKDDRRRIDDRRNYVLGWSNVEKIKALENAVSELERDIHTLQVNLQAIEKDQSDTGTAKQLLAVLLTIKDFNHINWQHHVQKIHELDLEKEDLLTNNDLLALLQKKKAEVIRQIEEVKESENIKTKEIGGIETSLKNSHGQIDLLRELVEQPSDQQKTEYYPFIAEKLADKTLTLSNIDKQHDQFRRLFEGDSGELRKLRFKSSSLRSFVEKKMREIKEHSKSEYSEIPEHIDARAEYITKFERLISEDLKRHEDRFKDELNKNTINSISVFDNQLGKHEKDIKEKIKIINQHLHEIVYNAAQGTYITILLEPAQNRQINLFREELKKCYIHSFSSNNELYTEEKYE